MEYVTRLKFQCGASLDPDPVDALVREVGHDRAEAMLIESLDALSEGLEAAESAYRAGDVAAAVTGLAGVREHTRFLGFDTLKRAIDGACDTVLMGDPTAAAATWARLCRVAEATFGELSENGIGRI